MTHIDDLTASAAPDARVAIIDTADDTRPWIPQLKTRGVQVIIRYLALGRSNSLPHKRIIDNIGPGATLSEAAQLLGNGFALVLVYEWGNSSPGKFVFGVDANGKPKVGARDVDYVKMATDEADADLTAALAQAAQIGLPDAPIYFTIDFDLTQGSGGAQSGRGDPVVYSDGTPVTNDTAFAACSAYFQRLNARLGKARLGLYAGGWASEQLRGLISYSWVAQSAGFTDTAKYLRSGSWHLVQQRDWAWFLGRDCSESLDIDTDIQNPGVTDIGARNLAGRFLVDAARTQAIFAARYVAKQEVPVYSQKNTASPVINKSSCSNGVPVTVSKIKHNNSVRVFEDDGTWLKVDMDEDGVADGFAPKSVFVANIKQTPDYS